MSDRTTDGVNRMSQLRAYDKDAKRMERDRIGTVKAQEQRKSAVLDLGQIRVALLDAGALTWSELLLFRDLMVSLKGEVE